MHNQGQLIFSKQLLSQDAARLWMCASRPPRRVRLVRTLPDTQPPRAILGLPDGTEIVVSPGSMVPAHGLVVVAIGRQSAQLARVTALGDHASVDSVTLTSMY